MKHDTERRNGTEYPTPGKWELNWVEADVISWRYDPEGDELIHDGPTAHVFAVDAGFGDPDFRVQVNGTVVDVLESDDFESKTKLFARIGDILVDHAPDEDD